MTSLLHENRLRLQQRITQRLRGEVRSFTNRDIIPQRYIPRRRRRQDDQEQRDPFRMQAHEYLYNDVPLSERWMQQGNRSGYGETIQLPVFKPRYTDMHTHKGVPNQKYVDVILNRKGPMHRVPNRYVRDGTDVIQSKKYDDSMTIRSYRHTDKYPPSVVHVTPENYEQTGIMLIAPQKIQYLAQTSNRLYEQERNISPKLQERTNIAPLKGQRIRNLILEQELNESAHVVKQSVTMLRKQRKRLNSSERKFVGHITQQPLLQKRQFNSHAPPLPPIRITVTNPLPTQSPTTPEPVNNTEQPPVKNQSIFQSSDALKHLPMLKLANTNVPRKKVKRKAKKREGKLVNEEQTQTEIDSNMKENNEEHERRQSDNEHLMPAPITKITFQSYNAANLKRPKKVPNNVQVERIGDVVATHPQLYRNDDAPAVKVSNFEMPDNPQSDLIFRKDGSLGVAPPSTNYVNFQNTTRLGGQSRILLSLKNRHLTNDEVFMKPFKPGEGFLSLHTNTGDLLSEVSQPTGNHEGMVHRKLGKIKAMKRSLLAAHNALIASESDGAKIEIDTVTTDEGRSERSFGSDQRPPKHMNSYYINRVNEPYSSNTTLQPPITGFYMGRANEKPDNAKTRNMATQWTEIVNENVSHNTPLAPPNTASIRQARSYYK